MLLFILLLYERYIITCYQLYIYYLYLYLYYIKYYLYLYDGKKRDHK